MPDELPTPKHEDLSSDPLRNAVRFPLRFKVRVETENGGIEAETEDVSSTGVLFRMPISPEINTRISWTMIMPAASMGNVSDIVIHCVGRVVWNAPGAGFRQVAAVIDGYRIAEAAR